MKFFCFIVIKIIIIKLILKKTNNKKSRNIDFETKIIIKINTQNSLYLHYYIIEINEKIY
jgi:hypothetical protein